MLGEGAQAPTQPRAPFFLLTPSTQQWLARSTIQHLTALLLPQLLPPPLSCQFGQLSSQL